MTDEERKIIEISNMREDIRTQTEAINRQTEQMKNAYEISHREPSQPFFSTEEKLKIGLWIVVGLVGMSILTNIVVFIIAIIHSIVK